jgi:hypothetical protein
MAMAAQSIAQPTPQSGVPIAPRRAHGKAKNYELHRFSLEGRTMLFMAF